MKRVFPLLAALVWAFPAGAWADTITLKNKAVIHGKVLQRTDDAYTIEVAPGVLVKITKSLIAKELKPIPQDADYLQEIANLPDTPEANEEIAQKCRTRSQKGLTRAHYERVVELDPSNRSAWAELDYVFDQRTKSFIREDTLNQRRGLVKHKEGWITAHAAALVDSIKLAKEEEARVSREVENAIKNFNQPGPRGIEAQNYLLNLSDPRAIRKLRDLVLKTGGDGQPYFDMLLKMPNQTATGVFIEFARSPLTSSAIVDASLDALLRTELSRDFAVAAFIRDLNGRGAKGPVIDRAAYNLQYMAALVPHEGIHPSFALAVPALMSKLITTELVQPPSQPGGTTFGADGGVSQSAGTPRPVAVNFNRDRVLGALTDITGQNFGFNIVAWRTWYASVSANTNLNLRQFD